MLSTPHMGSLWRKAMGQRWPSFKIPEHIVYYDRATLRRLLESEGFLDIQDIPYLHAFPLSLVLRRAGWKGGARASAAVRGRLAGIVLWLPATTICMAGRRA